MSPLLQPFFDLFDLVVLGQGTVVFEHSVDDLELFAYNLFDSLPGAHAFLLKARVQLGDQTNDLPSPRMPKMG